MQTAPGKLSWEENRSREYEVLTIAGGESASGPFRLECGAYLDRVDIAYETWGELDATRSNAVLICHALSGDSHVASHPDRPNSAPGWWEEIVGPGKAIDTNRYFVICSNVLGGCRGSTGPSSPHPADPEGRPYGTRFPVITIRDMVRAQYLLLRRLGVPRLHAVVGGSMGGMQALEWAATYPEFVGAVINIAAPARYSAQAIAYNAVQRQAILNDPAWQGGNYAPGEGPRFGLSLARMVGMITYQSWESMQRKFGRQVGRNQRREGTGSTAIEHEYLADDCDTDNPQAWEALFTRPWEPFFSVEHYLHYQGEKLVQRFDANTYLYLSRAMDLHDLGRGRGGLAAVLPRLRMPHLTIGISSDICFPPYECFWLVQALQARGLPAEYREIDSPWGHDAFLIEPQAIESLLREFLERLAFPAAGLSSIPVPDLNPAAFRSAGAFPPGTDHPVQRGELPQTASPRVSPAPASPERPWRSLPDRSSVPAL
ncbi:MAG: homoserine O-acetyltransferase [Limnochordales bacterium]|nr:homoserine O-acetyltransferase [Limnochordales bacterium]